MFSPLAVPEQDHDDGTKWLKRYCYLIMDVVSSIAEVALLDRAQAKLVD